MELPIKNNILRKLVIKFLTKFFIPFGKILNKIDNIKDNLSVTEKKILYLVENLIIVMQME
jgi:hypothetical protein